MCDLLRSIIKVLLFLVSCSICAEQESTDVNNIAEPELVDSQSKESESTLLPEDKVIVEESEAEVQLDSGTETTSPIDVMLVLDNSGSMKKNDPKFLVAEAIKEFISQKNENTRVGIIIFDGKVQLKVSLTVASFANRETILNSIKEINY